MNFVRGAINGNALRLFICGSLALFCELFLIRWIGSCVPFVKFYSNFILMSSFLGIGIGALCVRFDFKLSKYIFLFLFITIALGPLLDYLFQNNFLNLAYVKNNTSSLVSSANYFTDNSIAKLKIFYTLSAIYLINTSLFIIFGQWIGLLFKNFKPLIAYTIEIGGSILGILLFSVITELMPYPIVSVLIIFFFTYLIIENKRKYITQFMVFSFITIIITFMYSKNFIWTSYNKISISKICENDTQKNGVSDYLLNLNTHYNYYISNDNFLKNEKLREFYDFPYKNDLNISNGPVLIVGVGGGNEIVAALRNNSQDISVVEIDEVLVDICKKYQVNNPFNSNSVKLYFNDIRSFIKNTDKKYSRVIFSFCDDHSLLSNYSSIRLENFLFTYEAMIEFKDILAKNGKIFISLSQKNKLQKERLIKLMDKVFKNKTEFYIKESMPYFDPITFVNGDGTFFTKIDNLNNFSQTEITTDIWPFWYLDNSKFPIHYVVFMILIVLAGLLSLLILPKGERKIQFTYFFLGAGFFLIETSNVTSLSLLFGSNTMVNITVFIWILGLILLGNFTCFILKRIVIYRIFGFLIISLLISYFVPTSIFLLIKIKWIQSIIAGFIFLCPIYFASLIFANMIEREKNFYQAYGSNLLGAVLGGAFEYFSLVFGIKFLLVITAAFYALAALSIKAKIPDMKP